MPRPMPLLAAALLLAQAGVALAHDGDLAGAPNPAGDWEGRQAYGDDVGAPDWRHFGWRDDAAPPALSEAPARSGHRLRAASTHGGECWAQVRYEAQYGPPPSGPEYVWTRQPGPPGSPGPIWCLTVQSFPNRPLISPERYGWVRVLCQDQETAPRIAGLQRGLHARGLYRGEIDGRYDQETASAVRRFQAQRHIEHRGYLSYETVAALDAPPPRPAYPPRYTAFDTGYIDWPGKVRY